MKQIRITIVVLLTAALGFSGSAAAGEFTAMGEYLILRQMKITGSGRVVEVPIKPLPLKVETDGVTVRVATGTTGETDNWSTFKIYRSDGIGRQATNGGPLEVVPGVQATSDTSGVHKHLRLTRDMLTLTVFPGVSDQTVVTHAKLVPPAPAEAEPPTAADVRTESDPP
ncbi:hypothetical protein [Luteolibacter sp. Populi]|uniref:hypothetical protein n=1 Tax=Luteolibacter sp. Populi TaxID=3230487 RepID=UPI003465624C